MPTADLSEAPITILVADVVGSTALQLLRGDAEGMALIEACKATVRAQVSGHSGRVVDSVGDEVMAAFVSPRRAVACALAIRRELVSDSDRRSDLAVDVRIGLHTGEVLIDGGVLHGAAVSAANRVSVRAGAREVLASDVVRQLCGSIPDVEFLDHGLHELKGFTEPWRLFRVEAQSDSPSAGALTPFVGRDAPRGELRQQLERARRGEGSVVMIGGEPGVGKTRLAEEIGTEARRRGFGVMTGHCYETPGDLPYMPWVEIVEIVAREFGPEATLELMGTNAPALAQMVPELRLIFPQIDFPIQLPADQQRRYLFTCMRDFLARASNTRPLVLVFEDLHWADESTLTLLDKMMQWVASMPVLVIATFRDAAAEMPVHLEATLAQIPRRRGAHMILLGRHPQDEVAAMVEGITGQTPPPQLITALYAQSDGNAFFVEELLWHLNETGRLFDEKHNFRQTLAQEDFGIPTNIMLVTRHRLRRLSKAARDVLAVAAVVGRNFSFGLLEQLAPVPGIDLLDVVDDAERAQILVEWHNASYRFRHELIRHTLLNDLSVTRRQRYHLAVADALERRYSEDTAYASDIAQHLVASGSEADSARTARQFECAGDRAQTAAAYEEALRHFTHAAALDHSESRQAELLTKIGWAQRGLGHWDEATTAWNHALSLLEALGRDEAVAALCWELCQQLAWAYRFAEMVAVARRARAAMGERKSPQRARILGMMGVALALTGEPEAADRHAEEARALAESSGDEQVLADVGLTETFHNYFFMRPARVVEVGQRAAKALKVVGSQWNLAETLAFLDVGLVFQGHFGESAALHQELEPLADRLRHRGAASTALRNRFASAAAERADLEELGRVAQLQLRTAYETNNAGWVAFSRTLHGILDFWRGDWEQARKWMTDAVTTAGQFWMPSQQGWLMVLDAWSGESEAVIRRFEQLAPALPRSGHANLIGSWTLACLAAEAIGLVGGGETAGRLHDLVGEALATGTVMRQFDGRLLQTVAGLAAAAAGRRDAAERHFVIALRQADELPHRLEMPQAQYAYARFLVSCGDLERASEQARAAERGYAAIGMRRHADLARALVPGASSESPASR
jgi:class 3 adenylate cyclase/tetratricopeptide (TPR) repeat protein